MSIAGFICFLFNFISCFQYQIEMGFEREPELIYDIVMAAHLEGPKYNLEPEILLSLSFLESRWNPDAGINQDSTGLYQQLPQYSSPWNDDCWEDNQRISRNCENLSKAELQNLWYSTRVAARHLSFLIHQENNLIRALERYRWGNVIDETNTRYSSSVLRLQRQIFN